MLKMKIGGNWGEELTFLGLFLHKNGQNEYLCLIKNNIGGNAQKKGQTVLVCPFILFLVVFLKLVVDFLDFDKHIFK